MAYRSIDIAQKILDLAREHLSDHSLTPMQLLKLTYLAHGWTLGILGRPLTKDSVHAWQYGPVYPSLYQAIREFRSDPVECVPGATDVQLTPDEHDVLTEVVKAYGDFSGIVLSRLTHAPGSPWSVTWEVAGRSAVISNDLIEQYYRDLYRDQPEPQVA